MRTALITGASSGIGQAIARILAENNFNLVICGRRENRLLDLKKELSKQVEVKHLIFDVRDRVAVEEELSRLLSTTTVDVLVNNAGNAHGLSSFEDGNLDDWDAMIDVNVKGLLYVSKIITGQMVANTAGHIINIGSIAGKEIYPNGNVYCASKHAVDAINNSMRLDLNPYGIKVSQINPGLVETEFSQVRFKGDKDRAEKVYANLEALQAFDVAEIALFMLTRPEHVNISDVVVLAKAQASATIINRR